MTGAKTTRLASLQIAVFVLIGFWLLIQTTEPSRALFVSGLTGLLFGIAIVFRAQQTDITRTIASIFVPIIGIALLASIGLSGLAIVGELSRTQLETAAIVQIVIQEMGLNIAAGIAIFGTVGTIGGRVGNRDVSRLIPTAIGSLLTVVLFLVGFIYFRSTLLTSADIPSISLSRITSHVLQPGNPGSALVSFWLLVVATTVFSRLALSAVPLVELAPQKHEDSLKKTIGGLQSWLGFAAVLLIFLGIIVSVLFAPRPEPVHGLMERLPSSVSGALFATIQTEGLRVTLLALNLVFIAITFVFKGLEYLTGSIASSVLRLFPAVIGGLVAIALPIPITSQYSTVVSMVPEALRQPVEGIIAAIGPYGVLVASIGVAIGGVILILILVSFAGEIRYIPLQGRGGTLAAAGLAIGAITLALVDSAPAIVLAIITLSILTWNAGERGVTTRTELGVSPPLTLETLHSLGGVGIAIPAAALAWWIYTNPLAVLSPPEGTVIGVMASLLALTLLSIYIRG